MSDDLDRLDEEGVCSHEDFSVKGLIKLLKATAWSFSQAKMYETVAQVSLAKPVVGSTLSAGRELQIYGHLLPLFQAAHDYEALRDTHDQLRHTYSEILKVRMAGTYPLVLALTSCMQAQIKQRYFGTYYRVRFVGKAFPADLTRSVSVHADSAYHRCSVTCCHVLSRADTSCHPLGW